MRRFLRIAAVHAASILLGAAFAEGFLRLLILPEHFFSYGASPGIHSPDPELGFVYTPGFRGHWHHPDRVWSVPFSLDEFGYRPMARTAGAEKPTRVLLLGGRSMTAGAGLPDDETLHHHMVALSKRPLEVRTTGWAGVDVYRCWRYYLRTLDASHEPDLVLVCLNPYPTDSFVRLIPEDLSRVPPHPLGPDLFRMIDGIVCAPEGRLPRWMGRWYYRSYVGFGLLEKRVPLRRNLAALLGVVPGLESFARRIDVHEEEGGCSTAPTDPELGEEGLIRLRRFLLFLEQHFAERGARVAVVYMPSMLGDAGCYAYVDRGVPEHMARLDLHGELYGKLKLSEAIATGHYSARQARQIASVWDEELEKLLAGAQARRSEPRVAHSDEPAIPAR
jgi:hypothetical protein